MKFSVEQIAKILEGEVEGDGEVLIDNFAKIEEGKPGSISFLANIKYEPYIYTTESSAVIVSKEFIPKSAIKSSLIRVKDPYLSVSKLMAAYQQMLKVKKVGIHPKSIISDSAELGEEVFVDALAYIGDHSVIGSEVNIGAGAYIGLRVKIGAGTIIHPGAKVMDDCVIGENCVLHPGVVIGSEGFGFAPDENGVFQDIPQLGNVVLGDNVSIGANTTIDRATMGSTRIGKGVKLDNLVQIGHNVEIGENTVIASQTGVSGSTKIGRNCMIAGQVGFVGHIKIADGTKIGAKSGVAKSIEEPGAYSGHPLLPLKQYLRLMINLSKMK
ncbi:UDP-3-O-(3-hydroxymyristoyl)glucosamine N-acyltransferase [Leadbetterella byssophila]|uniref:UDP-3-O-acylglucosamine N-acyltransferase n=1 Tax=Leadbetterella byssophila (strain DSM 17132 / JCM 16389 / KACC 11308 / NBRC 106382 / 4M15) TaxID=649349 RepID=E4RYX3_LEAB4|nr:UDP-3-O-(3-hydroxymyristoyl)glucosamine N-acyltransferase [Leadbetterella byssophila]ADQ17370.1 UDP-3-O-(3-hydroxymyristoyl) glucosamine N-acyltransferase [Leadbetterella byssophila DSM 17132]